MKLNKINELTENVNLCDIIYKIQDGYSSPPNNVDYFKEHQDQIEALGFNHNNPYLQDLLMLNNTDNSGDISIDSEDLSYASAMIQSMKGSELLIDMISMYSDQMNIRRTEVKLQTAEYGWIKNGGDLGVVVDKVTSTRVANIIKALNNTLNSLLWYGKLSVNLVDVDNYVFSNLDIVDSEPTIDNYTNQTLDII